MKRKLLGLVWLLSAANVAGATSRYITTTDTQRPGYDKVTENSTVGGDHMLECKNPGYSACEFTIVDPPIIQSPNGPVTYQGDIMPYVKDKISIGIYTGNYTIPVVGGEAVTVTWNGSNVSPLTIIVQYP